MYFGKINLKIILTEIKSKDFLRIHIGQPMFKEVFKFFQSIF